MNSPLLILLDREKDPASKFPIQGPFFHPKLLRLRFSEHDSDWVCENFNYEVREGNMDPTFDMEENQDFKILEQERDFTPGSNKMQNLERGMQQSRRMIFILSV